MQAKRFKREECGSEQEKYGFQVVLDKSLSRPGLPDLLQVYVATIRDTKKTSHIVLTLNRVSPLPSLQHLKRVSRQSVLLCTYEDGTSDTIDALLRQVGADSLSDLRVTRVPAVAPRTTQQFGECNKLWSCNFHKNDALERLISGECFSSKERENNSKWMRMAVEFGRSGGGGAVVAREDCLVAAASGCSDDSHPLRHAVMVAIDLVARSQGGGAWPLSTMHHYSQSPPSEDPSGPYLCTGYDMFLSLEPCVMCAMALVHSRIRRVFFLNANAARGALVSVTSVQCLKPLNHHYQVFSAALQS